MDMIQRGLILLLKSAVTGTVEILPTGFHIEGALPLIKKHKIVSPAYEGAVRCGLDPEQETMRRLLQNCYQLSVKSEKQMRKVDQVFRVFEDNGIDHMGFKGCVLKSLYPQPALRPMGDADILVRIADKTKINTLMEEMGFTLEHEDDHVFLWRSNDLKVELHKCLVPPMDKDFHSYYGDGWRFAVRGNGHRYEMTPEDAYIFLFVHFARHYRFSGIGCRHVLDLYVYSRAYPDMDEAYICAELDKLGLLTFYINIERMLDVWFEDGQDDSVTELITQFIFQSGNWGTQESHSLLSQVRKAEGRAVRNTRLRSVWFAIFPKYEVMSRQYPMLKCAPFLLPLIWLVRILQILVFRRESIRKRSRITGMITDEKTELYRRSMEAVGLSYPSEN